MTDALRAQYEAYPYPARDPKEERQRLIAGSPSHLDEIVHYVFAGRLPQSGRFRVLVAGGGTGDGLIMLAQQCADAGLGAEIHYLDLSAAARAVAEARARERGLTSIVFHTGSLLDAASVLPGPADYIDCCGVLHHLDRPEEGLRALVRVLSPDGGMGLMLYGPYGRDGVYPMQSALRRLAAGDASTAGQVATARRLLAGLPPTNGLLRNPWIGDHKRSDADLYDLLLHSRDRPFTVTDLVDLVGGAGLAVSGFPNALRYEPQWLIADARLKARALALPAEQRWALAEELAGNIGTHAFYAVPARRREQAVARADDPGVRPILRRRNGEALARSLKTGQGLTVKLDGLRYVLPLPPLAAAMLTRIDGVRDLAALHREIAGQVSSVLEWATFKRQFDQLFAAFNGVNQMYLRT